MLEVSAGGVVFYGNDILLLKKNNKDWVIPKGRVEKNETFEETAIREVKEETGVNALLLEYIGKIDYKYKDSYNNLGYINKTVYWYLMKGNSFNCNPQKEEGFIDAKYIHMLKAIKYLKYDDERKIVEKAIDIYMERFY